MSIDPVVIDHPLLAHKLTQMRRRETTPAQFRQLLREASLLLAYEATRDLARSTMEIDTPLARIEAPVLALPMPVLVSIPRAGNAMVEAMLDLLPGASVGHVGIYRDHTTLQAVEYFFKVPDDIAKRRVIVADPMLATGNSAIAALDRLKSAGAHEIRFVCLLAAPEGIQALRAAHPDLAILTAAIDERLNEQGYIVPGLGDAGDRIYGT